MRLLFFASTRKIVLAMCARNFFKFFSIKKQWHTLNVGQTLEYLLLTNFKGGLTSKGTDIEEGFGKVVQC